MEKYLVAPIVLEYLSLNNHNAGYYTKLAAGLYELPSDSAVNPSLRQRCASQSRLACKLAYQTRVRLMIVLRVRVCVCRAYNTITWPPGREPFETVVQARAILSNNSSR